MGGQRRSLAVYPPVRTLIPTMHEDVWDSGPVRKGAENLAPIGIRPPDVPARSEWLCWVRDLGCSGIVRSPRRNSPWTA